MLRCFDRQQNNRESILSIDYCLYCQRWHDPSIRCSSVKSTCLGNDRYAPPEQSEQSKYADLGLPRLPEVSVCYQPEIWSVPKDVIYNATEAIQLAISYMPQIKTDVPQWQKAVEQDVVKMQCALTELRKLVASSRQ